MQWLATYDDGSTLSQFAPDGSERRYTDIDRARLRSFGLWDGDRKLIEFHFEPGQRLIYRHRVEQRQGGQPVVVYLVGWQQTVNGANVQSIAWVFPDGHIEMTGRWREDHPWFYSPKMQPQEV